MATSAEKMSLYEFSKKVSTNHNTKHYITHWQALEKAAIYALYTLCFDHDRSPWHGLQTLSEYEVGRILQTELRFVIDHSNASGEPHAYYRFSSHEIYVNPFPELDSDQKDFSNFHTLFNREFIAALDIMDRYTTGMYWSLFVAAQKPHDSPRSHALAALKYYTLADNKYFSYFDSPYVAVVNRKFSAHMIDFHDLREFSEDMIEDPVKTVLLMRANADGAEGVIQTLHDLKIDPNTYTAKYGQNLLQFATECANRPLIAGLVKGGANPNDDKALQTILLNLNVESLKILLDTGKVTKLTVEKALFRKDALFVWDTNDESTVELVKLLLDHGFNDLLRCPPFTPFEKSNERTPEAQTPAPQISSANARFSKGPMLSSFQLLKDVGTLEAAWLYHSLPSIPTVSLSSLFGDKAAVSPAVLPTLEQNTHANISNAPSQADKQITNHASQPSVTEKCGIGHAYVISNKITDASVVRMEGDSAYNAGTGKKLIFVGPNSKASIKGYKLDDHLAIPTSNQHDGLPECIDVTQGSILTVDNENIMIGTDRPCHEVLPQIQPVSRNNPVEHFKAEIDFLKTPFFHSSLFLHGLAFIAAFRQEIADVLLLKFSDGDQKRYESWQKGINEFREKNAVKLGSDLSEMAARISIATDLQLTENTTHIAKDFMQALITAKQEPKVYLCLLARAVDEAALLLDKALPYVSINGITQILTKTYEQYVGSGSKIKAAHTLIDNLPLLIPGSRVLLDTLDKKDNHLNKPKNHDAESVITLNTMRPAFGLRRRVKSIQ